MNIQDDVISIISTQSGVKKGVIKLSHELQKQPLTFDNFGLIYLAASLRAYVKQHGPKDETVKKGEISKSKFKVSDVVKLIEKKIEDL